MRKLIFALTLGFLATLQGGCQSDTFKKPITFQQGLTTISITFSDGTVQTTAVSGSGSVSWSSITGKPTFSTVATTGIYNDLLSKPSLFDGTWASLTGKPTTFAPAAHDHATLYKPIGYVPTWAEITNKPVETELKDALPLLDYLPIPSKTQAQINALVMPTNICGAVMNISTNPPTLQYWDGTTWWKNVITGN